MGEVADKIIEGALKEGRELLLEYEAKHVCEDYSIPTPPFKLVRNKVEAVSTADQLGYPVVMKIVSPHIIHKTEAGGVVLDLNSPSDVKKAYDSIIKNVQKHQPQAKIIGVLIQKMAPPSTEMIVGSLKDPHFGQTLMLGMGGIYVEVYKDVTFRVAPIDKSEAEEMVNELKGSMMLKGYRGKAQLDVDSVIDVILNVSKLVTDHMEVKQLDLNPVLVYEEGVSVVDARIILDL